MPSKSEIKQALRAARDANAVGTPERRAARSALRNFRDGVDIVSDTSEAFTYLAQDASAMTDRGEFVGHWVTLRNALPTRGGALEWTGGGGENVRAIRNRIRELLVDANSEQWLKDLCQQLKRTQLIDQNQADEWVYDQQQTDPIVVEADAAVAAAAPTTIEDVVALVSVLDSYQELTPDQPQ